VSDEYGNIINVTTENGAIQAVVGGTPAVRVTLDSSHNFDTNDLVRIDGVIGSTQLNDNTYYVHVITSTTLDLYFTPYMVAATATNNPVEYASTYVSGGYLWLDGLFTIADAITYSTSSITNRIYVNTTDNFIINTPVYFAQRGFSLGDSLISGIIDGEEYYVKEIFDQETVTVIDFIPYVSYIIQDLGTTTQNNWNTIAGTTGVIYEIGDVITATTTGIGTGSALTAPSFTMSIIRNGNAFTLVNDKQTTFVTQWEQMNVDRLWVTINGYRVPSSKLRLNENNNLSILGTIESGDQVIITSMIPTATPNEEIYMLNVNQLNEPEVLRTNVNTRTWTTYTLYPMVDTIFVDDVTKITQTVIQESVAPAPVDNLYSIGLISDKTMIASISVYNDTQNVMLEENTYYIDIVNMSPNLFITDGSYINQGDELIITVLEGNLIYVNGEQIQFSSVDFETNSISGLVRGSNGTGIQTIIPKYSEVYSMMNSNVMSTNNYNSDWNSDVYNVTEGDPLQVSRTSGALFLRSIT